MFMSFNPHRQSAGHGHGGHPWCNRNSSRPRYPHPHHHHNFNMHDLFSGDELLAGPLGYYANAFANANNAQPQEPQPGTSKQCKKECQDGKEQCQANGNCTKEAGNMNLEELLAGPLGLLANAFANFHAEMTQAQEPQPGTSKDAEGCPQNNEKCPKVAGIKLEELLADPLKFLAAAFAETQQGAAAAGPCRQNGGKCQRRQSKCPEVAKEPKDFSVALNVDGYSPAELDVKLVDNFLVVKGSHEEKDAEGGFVSRQFTRKFQVPENVQMEQLQCNLDKNEGKMIFSAPFKQPLELPVEGKNIPIQLTAEEKPVEETPTDQNDRDATATDGDGKSTQEGTVPGA